MLIEHVQGATVYGFQAVQKVPMVPRLVSTTIRRAPIGDAGVVNWQVHLSNRPPGRWPALRLWANKTSSCLPLPRPPAVI